LALCQSDNETEGLRGRKETTRWIGGGSIVAWDLAALVVAAVLGRLQGARQDRSRHVAAVEILESEIDPADIDQVERVFSRQGSLFVGSSLHHLLLPCPFAAGIERRWRAALAQ
jgi:hypothetical protein